MHIVYISREMIPTQRGGGIASYVKDMATVMAARGHKVTIICASDDTRTESDQLIDGVRVIRLKGGDFIIPDVEHSVFTSLKKLRMVYRFHSYRKRILAAVNQLEDADVIEVPDYGGEAYYLWQQKKPVVIRMHTPAVFDRNTIGITHYPVTQFYLNWSGKKEIEALTHFNHFSSCSRCIGEWYQRHFPQIKGTWDVIYNPLDTTRWSSDKKANSYSPNSVFYAGTVARTKGVAELISACARLREEGTPVTLTIAGKLGTWGNQLKEEAKSNGYTWCHFKGNISRDELGLLYRSSKVCCFPSHWENLPFVCLEAMAAGNVVIGSRSGGMSEMITDGIDGFLITPKDTDDIKRTLARALEMTEAEVEDMRTKARNTIDTKFSAERIIPQMEQYYAHLCAINKD